MIRITLFLIAAAFSASIVHADDFDALERKAFAGDYQAQRNVAYWLTVGNAGAPPNNLILGCAWRMVILRSDSKQVHGGDLSNKQLYCDSRLDADGQLAAQAQADKLIAQIAKRRK